ncbi:MAG TPA: GIY-YIG nuclease family protein [Candidatus Paceibacterota bacterium]
MDKLTGIYKIINKENHKIYIGESEDIPKRWVEHLTDLVSNEHCNKKLQNDFDQYGIKNFKFEVVESIILINEDSELKSNFKLKMTLLCREFVYINKYNAIKNGYNIVNSLKDIVVNNHDIYQRDKIADDKMKDMIHNFLKDNPNLIKEENIIKLENVNKSSHKNTTDNKTLTEIYKDFKEDGIISYVMLINDFRKILGNNNIIYFKDHSWYPTDISLNDNLIILGKEQKNNYGFKYNQIVVTEKGIDFIKNIFKVKIDTSVDFIEIDINTLSECE